jgi:phage FluMu protein gp41
MATVKCTLKTGLKVGDEVHLEAEIRELTAGDLIDATDESEKLIMTPEGYALLVSNTLAGLHTLRRQIVRIGDHSGPLTLGELKRLSGNDLSLLQEKALQLDSASLAEVEAQGKK